MLKELALYLLFVAAYCLPLFLDNAASLQLLDSGIRLLLNDVLANTRVRWEIALNIGGHLLLLAAAFMALTLISRQLASTTGVSRWAARLLTFFLGWTFFIACNALIFPTSDYSVPFTAIARPVLAYGLGILLCFGLLNVAYHSLRSHRWLAITIGVTVAAALGSGAIPRNASAGISPTKRNIIVIGVDSLSAAAFRKLGTSLPNLQGLMNSGVSYQRAYTPLGRTFPAWVSILSGQSPVDHGAIFNLRRMEHVGKTDLISSELQALGYRTAYAIDERRFNNLDHSFGFDHVIGPSAGALDFLLHRLNDTPLSNLVLQTRLGKLMMPFSYINSASDSNYDADGFVASVLNRTAGSTPLFLAVHFESAHFPFATRHAEQEFTTANPYWNRHAAALTVVDRQVGQLMDGLRQQGHLDDALVIVLSDHGEGLGEIEAQLTLGGEPASISVYGHGADVVSDHANHIVLGVIHYTGGQAAGQSTDSRLVSLLDLKSLMSRYQSAGDSAFQPSGSCMLVETGLRLAGAENYKTLDESTLAADAAGYYEIDSVGRMHLREDKLRELAGAKDVGIRCPDRITWFSHPRNRHFTVALDANGLPATELNTDERDVLQIEAYRARLQDSQQSGTALTVR